MLRVAVVGAGPAGIYAAAALSGAGAERGQAVAIDVFDRLPTPYGLVRYGTAPDHLRIKEVVVALRQSLAAPGVRFFGNVEYGVDLSPAELRRRYHAVIFATGATQDRPLAVPGIELPGSFGAADFVSWYNGHPDAPREWPLTAPEVAVIGAGNVALDVARMLAKPAGEQLITEIPDHVERGLAANQARDIHLFARRGPAEVRFTPPELRELAESPSFDVIVHPEGADLDPADELLIKKSRQRRTVVRTLLDWIGREPTGASRRIHLHFRAAPIAVIGHGRVAGIRTERTAPGPAGSIIGTGEFTDRAVQAVYRAIGYRSSPIVGLPFDSVTGVIPHDAGRVVDLDGVPISRTYVTGWIKRGPVGLIGHTKSDAAETIGSLWTDLNRLPPAPLVETGDVTELLRRTGVDYTTLPDWDRLDARELSLGRAAGRHRVKIVNRAEIISAARRP